MKWRPAPAIIRHPGPAIGCENPVTGTPIGTEPAAYGSRYPHVTILIIIHPGAIGRKLVIENLKTDGALAVGGIDQQEEHEGKQRSARTDK
jgi:hypothetical protein